MFTGAPPAAPGNAGGGSVPAPRSPARARQRAGGAPVPHWETCGQAWIGLLQQVLADPSPAPDDRGPVLEGQPALFEIGSCSRADPILARYGQPARMEAYDRKFTENTVCPPFKYSYGARLRDFLGVDQLGWAAGLLARRPYSKSAWLALTGPGEDPEAVPCLSALAFRCRGGLLHTSAVFRSQNAFTSYLNYLPLHDIQAAMARKLALPCGPMRVYVDIPHVYADDVPEIRRILRAAAPRTRCERKRRLPGPADRPRRDDGGLRAH